MDITKETIEKILSLAVPVRERIDNREYSSHPLHLIKKPKPDPMPINTLTGLVDYLKTNIDELDPASLLVHIEDPLHVWVVSSLEDCERKTFAHCKYDEPQFHFAQWIEHERFVIELMSMFSDKHDAPALLKIIGNLTDGILKILADDGITQQVTVKAGISKVNETEIPKIITLQPFRTFREIEQPESKFVFRLRKGRDGVECALFEAGSFWKSTALDRIKKYLAEALGKDFLIIC